MNADAKKSSAAYGWVGILAVATFAAAWLAAYSADPSWSFEYGCLGDFGISSNSDVAHYFNYGCIASGILLAAYGAGKATRMTGAGYRASGIVTAFAGLSVVMMGIFTKNYESGDYIHAFMLLAGFFISVSLVSQCIGLWTEGGYRRAFAGVGIVFALIVVSCYFGLYYETFEHVGAIIALIWFAIDAALYIVSGIRLGNTADGPVREAA